MGAELKGKVLSLCPLKRSCNFAGGLGCRWVLAFFIRRTSFLVLRPFHSEYRQSQVPLVNLIELIIKQQQNQMKQQQPTTTNQDFYILDDESIHQDKIKSQKVYQLNKKKDKLRLKITIEGCEGKQSKKDETQMFKLLVQNVEDGQSKWKVNRRYSDFQWLFKSLKVAFPGYVLPYFPSKPTNTFLTTQAKHKLPQLNIPTSKSQPLVLNQRQLQCFITGICANEIWRYSEQLKIFVVQRNDEYKLRKKNVELQMQELNNSLSTSNSIFSILERGLAWVSENKDNLKLEQTQQWITVSRHFEGWHTQIVGLLDKFYNLIKLKRQEIDWNGPETQIDSVERLKVKIVSGKSYNQIFIHQVEENIMNSLYKELRKAAQIDQQLELRTSIIKIIQYLNKSAGNQLRLEKLIRMRQKFEINFVREWDIEYKNWLGLLTDLNNKFSDIWRDYCLKMHKIWK